MAIKFSVLPPPIGMSGMDVLLIPDIDYLLKFAEGDISIYDTMKNGFIYKALQSAEFPTKESIDTFMNRGGFETTNDTDSYQNSNNSSRFNIPEGDINLSESPDMGLKAMEKVILKSIFETQKPYMEFIPKAIKLFTTLEDVSCRVLGLIDRSLKPQFNEKSLTYKLNKSKDKLDKLQNLGKDKKNPFGDLTKEDKFNGIDLRSVEGENRQETESLSDHNYKWEIVSTEYSTGNYIEGIDYTTIYRDILEDPIILDNSSNDIPPIEEDEKPPTIIFAYYNNKGEITNPPKQWIDRNYRVNSVGPGRTKWYGQFEQLSESDSSEYDNFLKNMISDRLGKRVKNKENLVNTIFRFAKPLIDEEFIEEGNENCFMNLVSKRRDGLELGNDSNTDVNRVTNGRKRMFLPKTINYKGKEVIIDPEADYNLQIIKLVPTKDIWEGGSRDVNNNKLKRTTPLVSNYKGVNISDLLDRSEYQYKGPSPRGEKARVHKVPTYKYDNTKVSYLIEGVLNTNPKNMDSGSEEDNDSKWYRKGAIFGAVKVFIDSIIEIFINLIPEVKKLLKLFKSPHELLFDVFFSKLETDFEAFTKNLLEKFSSLSNYSDKFERAEFIKNDPDLKKYVSLDEDLNYRFILDGFSGMELLGYMFGINITNFIPKLVLEKSNNFSLKSSKESINPTTLPTQPRNNIDGDGGNKDGDGNIEANMRKENPDGTYTWETISTEYSTGDFIKDIDYNYIYITEDVEKLLSKGDELFEQAIKSNDKDKAIDSLTEYNMALEKDPNNSLIKNKINELKEKFKLELNMILQLLMNIVSLPIKIVFSILQEFLQLFEDLAKILKIPETLEKFLSFEWILKYVKPDAIMDLIGLTFDPQLLFTWLDKIKSNTISDDYEFDLSKVCSIPLLAKLPTVNKQQLEIMKTKPLELMTGLFKLLELLIEGILCFIWNILNLDVIIPCPKFPLSKFASANLSPKKLAELLDGASDPLNDDNTSYKLVYDIKLPDGSIVKGLNYAELQNFIKDNQEFNYEVR